MTTQTQSKALVFDGYCPESKLIGRIVKMRLNGDDFWESEATGLQISVFPPYAAILPWRGEGNFKIHDRIASDEYYTCWLTTTRKEASQEIFPNIEDLIQDEVELLLYTLSIYESKAAYRANKESDANPVRSIQDAMIKAIRTDTSITRISLWEQVQETMPKLKVEAALLQDLVIQE